MPIENYQERKEAKIQRYSELAQKKTQEAKSLWDQAHKMADVIPFGQPILVGHHSEKSDRSYRNRINNKYEKASQVTDIAEHYNDKVKAMSNNTAISQDDPEAIQKLKIKLQDIENEIEQVKAHNAKCKDFFFLGAGQTRPGYKIIWNENGSNTIAKLIDGVLQWESKRVPDKIRKIIEDYAITGKFDQVPLTPEQTKHKSYVLESLNGNKTRIKKRIEALQQLDKVEAVTVEKNGISYQVNKDENRVMIYFPGKPSDEIRSHLKSRGFRWSPRNMAWQAFINNWAIDTAKKIIEGAV